MPPQLALIAHEAAGSAMLHAVASHIDVMLSHEPIADRRTSALLASRLGMQVEAIGGNGISDEMEVAARVAAGSTRIVVLLRDAAAFDRDDDVHGLVKVCDLYGVPVATNAASARLCLAGLRVASSAVQVRVTRTRARARARSAVATWPTEDD